MRKIVVILLALLLLAAPAVAFAEAPAFDGAAYNVESYMLVDAESGQVLAEKAPDERVYPSSTTKLMTALLLLETKGLEGEITVGPEVNFSSSSSLMGIVQGETVTIKDLFYGLLVCSGNDAAAALAVYMADDIDAFSAMMNERATELGMENTQFVNPHGLFLGEAEGIAEKDLGRNHYTTAADMAKLAVECAKHPEIMDAGETTTYQLSPTNKHAYEGEKENGLPMGTIEQSNRLIYTTEKARELGYEKYLYEYATGMKTGLVENIQPVDEWISSYGCLVASAEKDGLELIAVMFGDQSEKALDRWDLSRGLFEYGFGNYAKVDLGQYIQPVTQTEQVSGHAENDPQDGVLALSSVAKEELPGVALVDKATADGLQDGTVSIEQDIQITRPPVAPISQGEEMGTVSYTLNGEVIYNATLVADRKVYALGEEEQTEEAYELPPESAPSLWWLWIVIPGGAVGALFIVRVINKSRRGKYGPRRYARRSDIRDTSPARRQNRSTRGRYYDPRNDPTNRTRRKL